MITKEDRKYLKPQDLKYAARAKRHGAKHALRICIEARRAGIDHSLAFALVEKESTFRNTFGQDAGSILKHKPVTRWRVQLLLQHIKKGGVSNGVGLTQLTYPPFIRDAERLGGAHIPRNQLRVGFGLLRSLILAYGKFEGIQRYNGNPRLEVTKAYAKSVIQLQAKWHKRLMGK